MYGKEALSNEELLSLILKTGTKEKSVKELSFVLLAQIENLSALKDANFNSLLNIKGIGKAKACSVLALVELGRRIYQEKRVDKSIFVKNAQDIYNYINSCFDNLKQEHFYGVYLNTKKKIIDKKLLFMGSVSRSLIHPREIFKEAYLLSASYIIVIHNHPSGDVNPSLEDKKMTKLLKEISIIQGIDLIDHIIIGHNSYFSFCENDLL